MAKRLLFLFIILLTAYNVQSTTKNYLVVETTNGDMYSFGFSDEPIITFEKQSMKIKSKGDSHSFEISDVKEYTFSETEKTTGIENVQANELRINNDANGQVIIEGIQPNSKVRLFSIDGKEHMSNISTSDDRVHINLDSLPKGIYIVSVNSKSFKIYKK